MLLTTHQININKTTPLYSPNSIIVQLIPIHTPMYLPRQYKYGHKNVLVGTHFVSNMGAILLSTLFCLLAVIDTATAGCSSYTDCSSCADATVYWGAIDCLWCPLDRECHTWGSLYTPCINNLDVNDPAKCPATTEGTYSPNDAYMNTLLCGASYGDDIGQCVEAVNPGQGNFVVQDVIAVRCDSGFSDYDECVAYTAVSSSLNTIAVVLRGSFTAEQVLDQLFSYLTSPSNDFPPGGKVYDYFYDAFNYLYPCVSGSVEDLVGQYPSYKVVVTGHSLGGAIASLTAASLVYDGIVSSSKLELYAFGMPRVGNKEYAYMMDRLLTSSWNVVNYKDIVSHLPPCNILGCNFPADGPYHHMREIYYNQNGDMTVNSPYTVCHGNEDEDCSNGDVELLCINDIASCIGYHMAYFNTDMGDVCSVALGSSANPKLWSYELPYQCQSF